MVYRQRNTVVLFSVLLIPLIVVLLAGSNINVPYKIKTYSEVFPREKWILTSGNGGQIVSSLIDYSIGYTTRHDVMEFERGEVVNALFTRHKELINIGDTIAVLNSTETYTNLVTAKGDYEVAIADLVSHSSPEKIQVIEEADSELQLVQGKINEQEIIFTRTKHLFEKALCSQQEYELQKWKLDLLKIEENKITAQVENLKTGAKEEDINLLKTRIKAASSKIKALKQKEDKLTLVSPIGGKTNSSFNSDTLLSVINDRQVILYSPVRISDLQEITEGQKLQVSFDSINIVQWGQVLSINRKVKILDSQQVVFVSLLFENLSGHLIPGMVIENSMYLKDITLLDFIIRFLGS